MPKNIDRQGLTRWYGAGPSRALVHQTLAEDLVGHFPIRVDRCVRRVGAPSPYHQSGQGAGVKSRPLGQLCGLASSRPICCDGRAAPTPARGMSCRACWGGAQARPCHHGRPGPALQRPAPAPSRPRRRRGGNGLLRTAPRYLAEAFSGALCQWRLQFRFCVLLAILWSSLRVGFSYRKRA